MIVGMIIVLTLLFYFIFKHNSLFYFRLSELDFERFNVDSSLPNTHIGGVKTDSKVNGIRGS